MTTNHGSSRSLLKPRAVRADAALGTTTRSRAAATLKRLSPTDVASWAGRRRFPLAAPSWPETVPRPAPEHELGIDYDTDWSRKYPVRLARAMLTDNLTRPLARVIADPLVRGDEYLANLDAPVIFAANHTSHIDTPLLMTCLPLRFRHRTVVAAAADYFFDRRWKADLFAFSLAAIPIERNKVNRRSAQLAIDLVEDGWNLIIYPEGGRSPDGWGQIYRGGAAYLSVRTARPVVPVHLQGTGHILPKGGKGIRRTRTTVTFGTPLFPDEGEDARRFGVRIESAVATLADETTTDWWTARRRAVMGTTPALQGPDVAAWRRSWALPPATSSFGSDGAEWPRRIDWPRRTGSPSQ
ncbi:MAG TPA: lysophospholipid acyltransferase family protein [Acidimicrobiales bacterium]|nr:lysophospholipid acyltransferase family protein [Acidimicrobiales bacterium]